jgi:hypothetical protein
MVAGVLALMLLTGPSAHGQFPDLIVQVGDTTAVTGAQNTVISVYLSNYHDTVAGFNIWLQLDRPDILIYQTNVDTVIDTIRWLCLEYDTIVTDSCVDSIHVSGDSIAWRCDEWQGENCTDSTMVPLDSTHDWSYPAVWDWYNVDTNEVLIGSIDVTGTLVENWEWVDARSLSGYGTDLNIAGIADLPEPPTTPGIPPQSGGLLIKLMADVLDIPDTLSDRAVDIMIQSQLLSRFNFSRPDGTSIGILQEEVPDTNFWRCELWAGNTCLTWKRVSTPPYDSLEIGLDTISYIDTTNVWLIDGALNILPPPLGKCCYGDQELQECVENIEWACDTLANGRWFEGSGEECVTEPEPCPLGMCGDINGDGLPTVDISDLVYLVDYMFVGGPAPDPLWVADMDDCTGTIDISDLVYLVDFMFLAGPAPCANCK